MLKFQRLILLLPVKPQGVIRIQAGNKALTLSRMKKVQSRAYREDRGYKHATNTIQLCNDRQVKKDWVSSRSHVPFNSGTNTIIKTAEKIIIQFKSMR
jgi:hypothetical protein